MRRAMWLLLSFAVGFAVCHIVCQPEERRLAPQRSGNGPQTESRVLINMPDPSAPSGRRSVILDVYEATAPGRGTQTFRQFDRNPDGGPVLAPCIWLVDVAHSRRVCGPVAD